MVVIVYESWKFSMVIVDLASVVQKLDSTIHWINLYPVASATN